MGKDKHKKKDREYNSDEGEKKHKKKARKEAEKIAKVFGYSNDINPFGDSNLLQPFVWGKKVERDRQLGKEVEDTEEARLKLIQDIDKVRKRRADREKEVEEMQRIRDEEMRFREMAQYGDWEEKEEEFHMNQTKVRSKLRLIEKRERPIDLLAKSILLLESVSSNNQEEQDVALQLAQLESDVSDPLTLFDGLNDEDLTQLVDDVEKYLEIERKNNGPYIKFWESLKHVVSSERKNRMKKETTLHKSVLNDVKSLFIGKTSEELLALRNDIRKSIKEGQRSDVEYWELMEKEVDLEYSRSIIRLIHQDLLAKQIGALTRLREEALKRSNNRNQNNDDDNDDSNNNDNNNSNNGIRRSKKPREGVDYRFVQVGPEKSVITSLTSANTGIITNANINNNSTNNSTNNNTITRITDSSNNLENDNSLDVMKFMRNEEDGELGDMEEQMNNRDEITLPGSVYWWQDKYRPRKPRYYNRVKTGFDWNKYNSTHYDHDNPPPKTIQGYKFNIFYPDLIDKYDTPKYFLEAADEREYAIIRFHSGPPYEDIAFKILNLEWDTGRKSGFKCIFERGVLQLHFNFKRQRYRS